MMQGGVLMKKNTRFISMLLSAVMLMSIVTVAPFSVSAAETEQEPVGAQSGTTGNCTWTLDDNGVLTINGNGAMGNNNRPWGSSITAVVIESGVTSVGEYAFYDCTGLISVTIPDSVTDIGNYAFYRCTGLISVTIPDSVTDIGNYAFYRCTGLASITIPNSVTSIGYSAFSGCTNLSNVTLCDGLTVIGSEMFYGCTGLTSITIPDSITSIGYAAFRDCTNLSNVTLCDGLTTIGSRMFSECTGLTSITIPGSLTNIGTSSFYGCTNLSNVTLCDGLKTIGAGMFDLCTGLTSITIPDSVTSINGFSMCTGLTSITIPDSVTSIGNYAFEDCRGLTSVTIGKNVNSIGYEAFYGCTGLTDITIPNSVTSIGYQAFNYCTGLTSITILCSEANIDSDAFRDCTGLTSVHINDLASWFNIGFYGYRSNPLYYAHNLYLNNELVTDLIIPDSVTSIGFAQFYNCTSLASVTIPDSVTSIYSNPFEGCTGLTSIVIANGNTDYDSRKNCNAVIKTSTNQLVCGCKTTIIPNSVTSIGRLAFRDCAGLTRITIPDSVTSIGEYAFYNCTGLTSVTIPKNVLDIDGYAFGYCTGLRSVTLCDGLKTIGDSMFCNCTGITSITIPDSVIYIGKEAFYKCTGLTSITIPDSVTSIGYSAFAGCTGLTSVRIGKGVIHMDEFAFGGCESLKEIIVLLEGLGGEKVCNYFYGAHPDAVIWGYPNSWAQHQAELWEFPFRSLTDAAESYGNYYSSLGKYAFVARDTRGLSVAGCTLTVGDTQYAMNKPTFYANIPDGFTGNVTVSKPGYLSSTLPAECLKKTNFFVMYSDSEPDPVVQHLLLRNTSNKSNAFTDLLRSDERIYDLGNKTYDLYVGYNSKNKTVSSVYLLQGNTKIKLQSGMNRSLSINKTFSSDGGTIYICLETSDGKVYKKDSRIVALKERITVDFDLGNSISDVVDDSLTALGGWNFKGKFKLGDLPVSLDVSKNGHVKGTIGIKGEDSYTSTWYEGIKGFVKKHEKDGKTEYTNEDMEDLEKFLKQSGADVTDGYCSAGFDVSASIIGCFEGDYNWLTGRMENVNVSLIFKVGGEAEYTKQSVFTAFGVPVPYYWKVAFGLEISAKIAADLEYGSNNKPKLNVNMPSLTIEPSISGSLCLGIDKIFGGGGKLSGQVSIKFEAPNYDLKESEWELSYKVALTGQLAGFSGDLKLKDGKYMIYPKEESVGASLDSSVSLMNDFLSSAKHIDSVGSQTDGGENALVSLAYGYADPKIATLSDGTAVMAWVDYDTQRSTANQAALYYSVLNKDSGEWSAPAQVENDGTADDLPVLKSFGNNIYLVWNDADEALGDSATMADMLAAMGVSYAVFNGTGFSSISNVTAPNGFMDICPDITVADGKPTVVWLKNEAGDLFGQGGTNVIMQSTLENGSWSTSEGYSLSAGINSFCVVNEDGQPVVYFSADSDGNAETFNDYDVFRLSGGTVTQITETEAPETDVCAYDNVAYWNENGVIKGSDGFEAAGVQPGERYIVTCGENGGRTVIYTQYNDETVSYMMKTQTGSEMSEAVTLADGVSASGGMAAFYNNGSLVLVTDEISENSAVLRQYGIDNRPDVAIEKAVYNPYTLVAGEEFYATAYVKNNGLQSAEGYTVYAYNGSTLLCSESIDSLAPGERVSVDMRFDLPETVDFDKITFYVSDNDTNVTDGEGFIMPLSLTDISIENLDVISDGEGFEVSASVVNRGIGDIENAVLCLRSNSADGEVLDTCTVANLGSREEYIYSHTLSAEQLDGVTRLYLTAEPLDGEDNTVNNEDYALIRDITDTDTEVTDKFDTYDRLSLDEPKTITIENAYDTVSTLFIPQYSGNYTFFSTGSSDTYGYLLDGSENELTSNDDGGEGYNFKITYTLEAGKAYFIKSKFYGSTTGSFNVTVQVEYLFGDADGDGRITVKDSTAIQRHLAEYEALDEAALSAADTNGDGSVTIDDVTCLQMFLAEYDIALGRQAEIQA